MSEQTCTRDEFAADRDGCQTQVPLVRAEYLTERRKQAGLTQAETADAWGCPSSASPRSKAEPWRNSQPWLTTSGRWAENSKSSPTSVTSCSASPDSLR